MSSAGLQLIADWVAENGARDKALKTAQYMCKLAMLQATAFADVSQRKSSLGNPLHAVAVGVGSLVSPTSVSSALEDQRWWMASAASAISMSRKVVILGDSIGDLKNILQSADAFTRRPSAATAAELFEAAGNLTCSAGTEISTVAKMIGQSKYLPSVVDQATCTGWTIGLLFNLARGIAAIVALQRKGLALREQRTGLEARRARLRRVGRDPDVAPDSSHLPRSRPSPREHNGQHVSARIAIPASSSEPAMAVPCGALTEQSPGTARLGISGLLSPGSTSLWKAIRDENLVLQAREHKHRNAVTVAVLGLCKDVCDLCQAVPGALEMDLFPGWADVGVGLASAVLALCKIGIKWRERERAEREATRLSKVESQDLPGSIAGRGAQRSIETSESGRESNEKGARVESGTGSTEIVASSATMGPVGEQASIDLKGGSTAYAGARSGGSEWKTAIRDIVSPGNQAWALQDPKVLHR